MEESEVHGRCTLKRDTETLLLPLSHFASQSPKGEQVLHVVPP
jgi:hypothetical protein